MPLLYLNTRECRWYLMGEGEMKKIAAISLISIFIMSGCAVHNDETSIGKFGLAYKSNIQRKLDNQYYTEAEASLARGRISGAENIVKNDAAHFCVTQGKKMQIVDLKTEGAGLHGVARLTFFGKRQTCAFWLCLAGTCASTMPLRERHRAMKGDSIDVVNGRR